MYRRLIVALVFYSSVTVSAAVARPAGGPLEIEDRPEPFVPQRRESEAERHRREALSLYAAGLMYEQAGNREEALRHYQRALRYDPDSSAVLQQIVETAWGLERHQEAVRYALRAAESAPSNPELLERLAAFLVQENDLKRAI